MKKPVILAGTALVLVVILGIGIWISRPVSVLPEVETPPSAPVTPKTESVANEDVVLIEGGVATSEHFIMVTNPSKK
jgi:hypothetical protein